MLAERIGPYRIIGKLGEGGMGEVFEAMHETIERRVALKVLHKDRARNPEAAARFFNERRSANRRREIAASERLGNAQEERSARSWAMSARASGSLATNSTRVSLSIRRSSLVARMSMMMRTRTTGLKP